MLHAVEVMHAGNQACMDSKCDTLLQSKAGAQGHTAGAKSQLAVMPRAADAVDKASAQGCGRSIPHHDTAEAFYVAMSPHACCQDMFSARRCLAGLT